ncbi:hypothetical protein DU508_22660 [Pedobacter chinensis]|uniref:non-specific protein-tyrosine kinase n=1 Tax=Pedobacter chinensis TaxID=2282421 RepID=A0A369PPS5_9SPHI|nr:polysaccharide biosynthesis tyrosine autokinase [Pedobacter chinensis]RDC54292.1 hypothetical protein DU508_22660 [Pedobacter chinensis]
MITQQAQFTTYMIGETGKSKDNWKGILGKYLFHWPLFLIALVFALLLAFVYLKRYKPVYQIRATLIVKDDSKSTNTKAQLDDIGLTNNSQLIENEIKVLKSRQLVSRIVDDLGLWVNYYRKDGLFSENDGLFSLDMYKDSPVKFVLEKQTGKLDNAGVKIRIIDGKSFTIYLPDKSTRTAYFNEVFTSSFGIWKLIPSKNILQSKGKVLFMAIADPETKTLELQRSLDASLSSKLGTSIDLAVSDINDERGKDILNGLISEYYASSSDEKNRELKNTLDFLDQRLASLNGELSTAETGIETFKSSKGLTDISSQTKISLENLQANDAKLNEANLQLSVINGIDNYVNSGTNSNKIPSAIGINDAALSSSIEKLANLQLLHDKMAANMPESNPEFDPINRQIKTTRALIKENVKNIRNNLLDTRNKLQIYNNKFESSIRDIPSDERQFVNIKRQQSSKENTYTYLLQKREEVAIKYASNLSNNRIVDDAYSEIPKSPKPFVFLLSLVFVVGMPLGLIYGRNALSDKVVSLDDITKVADVKVIGEIPYEDGGEPIAIRRNSLSAISEQLRALRIKLYYLHNKVESGRVTLITSSVSNEGKSFISVNMGSALSLAQKKTVILELDLRKPKITRYFDLPQDKMGLSDYLNDKANIDEIIQKTSVNEYLDIIPSGKIVENPSELLEKKKLESLILDLKERYDDIIIDSPPVHLVPDAILLSRLSDVTLYVIRQGYTEKSEIKFLKSLKDEDHLKNTYVVFNSIERVKHGYGYSYDESYYNNNAKRGFLKHLFSDFKSRF